MQDKGNLKFSTCAFNLLINCIIAKLQNSDVHCGVAGNWTKQRKEHNSARFSLRQMMGMGREASLVQKPLLYRYRA